MSSKLSAPGLVLLLVCAFVVAGVHPAAAQPQAIITNGTVTIGVNQEGHLVVVDPSTGFPLGLQRNATGDDGLRTFVPKEGWGVAVPGTSINGYVNHIGVNAGAQTFETRSFQMIPFSFTSAPPPPSAPDRATSVVRITDGFNPVLEVTHEWIPIAADFFTPFLYQANVTIRNLTSNTLGSGPDGLRYRRLMDWDA